MIRDLPPEAARYATPVADDADALRDGATVQTALLVAGVACARALADTATVDFVAGHSVGAYAAAVVAGVLTLDEALEAVALRARLMDEACAGREWGMAAISGLPIREVYRLLDRVSTDADPLWPANVNGATQVVVSGTAAALDAVHHAAADAGARDVERLAVTVASHCPLQDGTARRMAEHLAAVPRRTPTARYVTNTGGRAVATADAILDDLAAAVAQPVQWYDGVRVMAELGVTVAVETRPGHVLTRLVSAAAPTVRTLSLQDDSFATVVARMRRAG